MSGLVSIYNLHQFTDDNNRKTLQKIDSEGGSGVVISHTHYEIHEGNAYSFTAKKVDLADSAEYAITMTLPAGGVMHFKNLDPWMNNARGEIDLVSAPTSFSGGKAVSIFNHNRTVTATTGAVVKESATFAGGTVIDTTFLGGGGANVAAKAGGQNNTDIEWILNSATTYVLNMKNFSGAAATMTLKAFGYKE